MRPSQLSGCLAAILLTALSGCNTSGDDDATDNALSSSAGFPDAMGARYDSTGKRVRFRVHSPRATHLEVDLYAAASGADEVLRVPMKLEAGGNFNTATSLGRNLIIDSLAYWKDSMGVDGFRSSTKRQLTDHQSRRLSRRSRLC